MKIIHRLLVSFIILLSVKNSIAAPIITSFTTSGLTTDGKVLVSNTQTTNKTFSFTVTRSLINGAYEPVLMTMQLVYKDGSNYIDLSQILNITTTNFNNSNSFSSSFTVDIPAGYSGGSIQIRYDYTDLVFGGYYGPLYIGNYLTTDTGTIGPPPPSNYTGELWRDVATQKIYFNIDGTWRHIQNIETLVGCWGRSPIINNFAGPGNWIPAGNPITLNTRITRHIATQRCYFQDGNILRYIPSTAIKNKYHFVFNYIANVNDISQYIMGPDLN